ncbi:AraC family transcriptional regulator [Ensifer sp. Root31]|uniref:helix-turn-helix domain-containing protein n=1 Tax=Ensifer sp. Root31 TaxID=1736512 RepID=UPI00070AEF5E|nr:helix-turn-helix domain-containing protein [Ensifer sp. Root31]KQU86446.1 AraC family transcriptional regulator [Ensifer sp. Root31]
METLSTPVHRAIAVETLQAEIYKNCGIFHLEPMSRTGMVAGNFSRIRVGHFDTAVVSLDAKYVRRDANSIRKDPGEHLFLIIQDQGSCRIDQGERSVPLEVGDMFLVDSVRPSAFVYNGVRSNQMTLHLPREEMFHRLGKACLNGIDIRRDDALWSAIRAVLIKLASERLPAPQLNEALMNLLGAYFHGIARGDAAKPSETLLSRALALIDRYYLNPAFRPSDLARQLNVPERMLQRHFQPLGETPSRRLLNRRLEFAHARLKALGERKVPDGIAPIAYDAGFNDLSHFYREFRKKYAVTPGDVVHSC